MNQLHNILLVEDQGNWQDTLRRLLEQNGYSVEVIGNFSSALKRVRMTRAGTRFTSTAMSLCVLDLDLREADTRHNLDGYGLITVCVLFRVPLIIVSDYLDELDAKITNYDEVVALYRKDSFDEQAFIQSVRQATTARPTKSPKSSKAQSTPQATSVMSAAHNRADTNAQVVRSDTLDTLYMAKLTDIINKIKEYYEKASDRIYRREQNNHELYKDKWSPIMLRVELDRLDAKRKVLVEKVLQAKTSEELNKLYPEVISECVTWGASSIK